MLSVYVPHGACLDRIPVEPGNDVPDSAIWFDLVTPTQQEDKLLERHLGIAVPTREEMQEIEVTSRLYVENGARYMTATLMCQSDTDMPKTTPVTFILSGHRLITVRYDEPRPFMIVGNKLGAHLSGAANGETVLMDLLDAVIDRAADILERIGAEVDQVSHEIFEPEDPPPTAATRTSSRRSGARATSPRRCAKAWFRSGACCSISPTRPTACAGPRRRARSCAACSATCSR